MGLPPHGFSLTRSGELTLGLDDAEHSVLLSLAQQMAEFVAPEPPDPDADPLAALVGIDPDARMPDDPALARLFPDAFRDDPDAAAEFRRFTERDLRDGKLANALTVARALEVAVAVIPVDDVPAWLGFLNDTRLTLGSRLDIREENHEELAGLPATDPRTGLLSVYDWLTYLQDSLVQLLLPSS